MNTALDVFKKVSEHLLTQNEKALDANRHCVYISKTGLKCAVGCLIDDDFYFRELGVLGVRDAALKNALKLSGVPITEEVLKLLEELQQLHDFVKTEGWVAELARVKIDFFGGEV